MPRLGVQRLRTLQEKKAAQAKAARRDIAMLIEKGKIETARIKVENSKIIFLFPSVPMVQLTNYSSSRSHKRGHLRGTARATRALLRTVNRTLRSTRPAVGASRVLGTGELTQCNCSTREPDPAVSEGVCAIIYAAPRTELKGTGFSTSLAMLSLRY